MTQPPKKISILLGGLVAVTILLGLALLVSSWMSWRTSGRIARAIFMFRAAETGRSVLAAARHFPDSDPEKLSKVISEAMPDSVLAFQVLDRNARVLFSINDGERGSSLPQAAHILKKLNPRNEVFTLWREDNGQNPVFEIFRIFMPITNILKGLSLYFFLYSTLVRGKYYGSISQITQEEGKPWHRRPQG